MKNTLIFTKGILLILIIGTLFFILFFKLQIKKEEKIFENLKQILNAYIIKAKQRLRDYIKAKTIKPLDDKTKERLKSLGEKE